MKTGYKPLSRVPCHTNQCVALGLGKMVHGGGAPGGVHFHNFHTPKMIPPQTTTFFIYLSENKMARPDKNHGNGAPDNRCFGAPIMETGNFNTGHDCLANTPNQTTVFEIP